MHHLWWWACCSAGATSLDDRQRFAKPPAAEAQAHTWQLEASRRRARASHPGACTRARPRRRRARGRAAAPEPDARAATSTTPPSRIRARDLRCAARASERDASSRARGQGGPAPSSRIYVGGWWVDADLKPQPIAAARATSPTRRSSCWRTRSTTACSRAARLIWRGTATRSGVKTLATQIANVFRNHRRSPENRRNTLFVDDDADARADHLRRSPRRT